MLDRVVQARLRAAEKYGRSPLSSVNGIDEWPWTWIRVSQLIQILDNVREFASIKKSPVPPREIVLDYERARAFIEENAKTKEDNEE